MSIAHAFVQALANPTDGSPPELAELESALSEMLTRCRSAWPQLDIAPHDFARYLAYHLGDGGARVEAIHKTRAEELYLAFGCYRGDPTAIALLETSYASHIDAVLSGIGGGSLSEDDLRQVMRRRLFVADGDTPARISRYSGQGSLAAWLRVTIKRAALNAVRDEAPPAKATADDLFNFPQALGDPELDYLKGMYRDVFRDAFLAGVEQLSTRERTLLRQSVVHGLNVRQIGRIYNVHHGTAARWVAQARDKLVRATRGGLAGRLKVSDRELESIMGLIASRLDYSVARVLEVTPPASR